MRLRQPLPSTIAETAKPTTHTFVDIVSFIARNLSWNRFHIQRSRPIQPQNTPISLRVPSALPALASGLRVAAVYAPVGALIGEWVGASSGLGYAMLMANGRAQTDVVFAALALLAVMALLVRAVVVALTRHIAPWAPETRT